MDSRTDRSSTEAEDRTRISRRRFVAWAGRVGLALPASSLLAACGDGSEPASPGGGYAAGEKAARQESGPSGQPGGMDDPRGGMSAGQTDPPAADTTAPVEQTAAAQGTSGSAAEAPSTDALVTEVPAMASLVQTLKYVNESEKPDERCANCQLYYEAQDGRGRCRLFSQGWVSAQGWCTSWIKQADAA